MKAIKVISLIALCCLNSLSAQEPTQKIKIYRTWVSLNSEPFKIKGALYEVKDSSILVSSSVVIQDYYIDRFEVTNLHINNIETIKTRRNNSVGIGVLIGAITGFAVGGLIGLIDGDDPPCSSSQGIIFSRCSSSTAEEKALSYGVGLAYPGAVVGAVVGSITVTIPINGSIQSYNSNKDILREYSIKKQ